MGIFDFFKKKKVVKEEIVPKSETLKTSEKSETPQNYKQSGEVELILETYEAKTGTDDYIGFNTTTKILVDISVVNEIEQHYSVEEIENDKKFRVSFVRSMLDDFLFESDIYDYHIVLQTLYKSCELTLNGNKGNYDIIYSNTEDFGNDEAELLMFGKYGIKAYDSNGNRYELAQEDYEVIENYIEEGYMPDAYEHGIFSDKDLEKYLQTHSN